MTTLISLLFLLVDIPHDLYSDACKRETIDSAYAACRTIAAETYETDHDAAVCYLMADWAYGESLVDVSNHFITLALDAEISSESLKADCLSMASAVKRLKGDLSSAIKYAEECLLLDREVGDKANISSSLNNIAGLYLTYGDAENARKYIDEAMVLEEGIGRSGYLAIRYGVASEIYLKLGETDRALELADHALQIDSLDGRADKIAVRRSQKGAVLMEMGDYAAAERELDLALPVFINGNNMNSLAITYTQLGEIALKGGDKKKAEGLFLESLKASTSIGHIYMESRASYGLYELYKDGSPEKALEYLKKYTDLRHELQNEKATEMMQAFNVKYEMLEKDQLIMIQNNRIRWRNACAIFMSVIIILLAVLVVLRSKAVKAMEERNAVLVKANLDKDRMLALAKSKTPTEELNEIISIVSATEDMPVIKLTKREIEIAELCAKGMLNKEIAVALGISPRTVETHKNNLFRKLGINNTVELMRYMQWYHQK